MIVAGITVGADAVGVKVVVIEDTVHVIFCDNLLAHVHNALHSLITGRIKHNIVASTQQESTLAQSNVLWVTGCVPLVNTVTAIAIGINPCVAFHTSLVATLNGIGQRIPSGHLATRASEVT